MVNLVMRNCRVFLRDRAAVLYSFLAVFIIIGLYILFLGDAISGDMTDIPGSRFLMDSWIMAGLLAAGSFTTTLGVMGIRVEDRASKISRDFMASPLSRGTLTGGYTVSSIIIGFILSVVTLILAEGYILLNGGTILPPLTLVKVLAVLLLSVLASSAMISLLIGFVGSNNAFAGISTVGGTLIGFITGIYLPIGTLPPAIQTIVKCFPISHAAAALRKLMMEVPMQASFAGAPAAALRDFQLELGVSFQVGGSVWNIWPHIGILALTAVVFFGLAILRMSKQER